MSDLSALKDQALAVIKDTSALSALEELRVQYLGKKGLITEQLKSLSSMPEAERKSFGAAVNAAKDEVTNAIAARKEVLEGAALSEQLKSETLDISLPPRPERSGKIHPISQVLEEITAIFTDWGFAVAEGPAIEDDYHNFTALNFPEGHPAREMHDTFYLKNKAALLRTHTSPVQNRTMKAGKPPFRFIAPGVTFRCDSDMTHTPMFHQFEGVVIDKGIHMGHLKGCVRDFLKAFFEIEGELPVRFRPSFFPFTEPSAEVDIGCSRENGELRIGAGKDWLEVAGCGMIHANVLSHGGIDPKEWQGFAFGFGVERLAMLKYGIPDLRTFFASDVRWLQHYGFDALDIPSLSGGLSK